MDNNFQQSIKSNPLSQPIIQQPVNQQSLINKLTSRNKLKWILLIIILLITVFGSITYYLATTQTKSSIKANQKTTASPSTTNPPAVSISPVIYTSVAISTLPTFTFSRIDFLDEIQNSIFVFDDVKNDGVMLLNGLKSKPILIDKYGTSPIYSAIFSKVAFTKELDAYTHEADGNIYVYDIKTKKTEIVRTNYKPFGSYSIEEWSPNGKYLLTDAGTGPERTKVIFEYPSGAKISTIHSGSRIIFDQNGNLIFNSPERNITPKRPWGSGAGTSITRMFVPSGQKQTILNANSQYDYLLIEVKNNIIYYERTDIQKEISCINNQCEKADSKTYWQMDSNGQNAKSIDGKTISSTNIKNIVSSNLSGILSNYEVTTCYPNVNFQNWVACSFYLYNASGPSNWKIGLFNLDKPSLGVIAVIDGYLFSW